MKNFWRKDDSLFCVEISALRKRSRLGIVWKAMCREVRLHGVHEPITAIAAMISVFLNSMPFLIAGYGVTYGQILLATALIGTSLWSSASMKSAKSRSQARNGHLIARRGR